MLTAHALAALPSLVEHYCSLWGLCLDGQPWHGYLGLVLPVRRGQQALALKLTRQDTETRDEALALRTWDGEGAVKLIESVPGVLLLERLHADRSLSRLPIEQATLIAANLLRRLAVSVTSGFVDLDSYTRDLEQLALRRWERFGRPFPRRWFPPRPESYQRLLLNQDLHFDNVLAGDREPWLVIDPKPLCGDPEFGVAPLLWNRTLDDDGPLARLNRIVAVAALEPERTLHWALFRTVEYWLWALDHGFTEDPIRCRRLAEALTSRL